jgi:hypothetical protein
VQSNAGKLIAYVGRYFFWVVVASYFAAAFFPGPGLWIRHLAKRITCDEAARPHRARYVARACQAILPMELRRPYKRNMGLESIAQDVWVASMPHRFMGLQMGARMTVVRLPDGSLFVYSPIRLNPELGDALDAIGPVRHIVAPSLYHHLFVGDFAAAYPSAKTYAAPGLDKKRKDFPFDEILGNELDSSWRGALTAQPLDGCAFGEVLFFHEPSRTLISADLVENFQTSDDWPTRTYLRAAGIYGKCGVSRLIKPMFRDKAQSRRAIDRALEWNPERITLSHGVPVLEDGREALREAYDWLKTPR